MNGKRSQLSRGSIHSNYAKENTNEYGYTNSKNGIKDEWKSEVANQAKFVDQLNQRDKSFITEQK